MCEHDHEQEWADRFDQDLHTFLRQGELPPPHPNPLPQDYQAALRVAQRLQATRVTHLSRVQSSLRRKLMGGQREEWNHLNQQQGGFSMNLNLFAHRTLRRAAGVVAILAVTVALAITIQPVGALASQLLGEVGLFRFTNEQAIPDEWIGQKNFNNGSDEGAVMPVQSLTGLAAAEAERQASFSLYTPSYLPACFTLNDRSLLLEAATPTVLSAYLCAGETGYEDVFLQMHQSQLGDAPKNEFQIGDAQPVAVTVRGQAGMWIEQAPIGVKSNREGATALMPVNMLVWEEDGFHFQLQSNQLSQDEMLKVAESLQ